MALSLNNLAGALEGQGKRSEAEPIFREALAMREKLLGVAHPDDAQSLNNLAGLLVQRGQLADAEAMFRGALGIVRAKCGPEHPAVAVLLHNLGSVMARQGKFAEAEPCLREALAMRKKLLGSEHPNVANTLGKLAGVLVKLGGLAEAEAVQRERLALLEKLQPDDWSTFLEQADLGWTLHVQNKDVEAEKFLRSGYEGMKQRERKMSDGDQNHLRDSLVHLERFYAAMNQPERAAEWKMKWEEFDKRESGVRK